MAQPRKSDAQSTSRGRHIKMRVPRELYDEIVRAAAAAKLSVPQWVMAQCRGALGEKA